MRLAETATELIELAEQHGLHPTVAEAIDLVAGINPDYLEQLRGRVVIEGELVAPALIFGLAGALGAGVARVGPSVGDLTVEL